MAVKASMPTLNYLALDVGHVRVGVAHLISGTTLPKPLTTLRMSDVIFDQIAELATKERAEAIIIGLPRNLDSNETDQTRYVMNFTETLRTATTLPLHFQDEALSSVKAQDILKSAGKAYNKEDIDALAASLILEDYIIEKNL